MLFKLSKEEETRALEIHRKAIIINACTGVSNALSPLPELARTRAKGYIEKMREGGVTAPCLTVSSCHRPKFREVFESTVRWRDHLSAIGSDKTVLVTTAEGIREAKRNGLVGVIFHVQNATQIDDDENLLTLFYNLGIETICLTYQCRNLVGDGCGEKKDGGLSLFGERVVERMNKLHMLIDLAHVGYHTTMDVIELSKDPVAFTHANVRALHDIMRNKSDEQMKALAERGGVMGITAIARFIRAEGAKEGATMKHFLDNIDYAVDLIGSDHVGLGLDITECVTKERFERSEILEKINPWSSGLYMGGHKFEDWYPKGLDSCSKMFNITKGLVARGYSDQEIFNILGGSFLRLFEKVWRK